MDSLGPVSYTHLDVYKRQANETTNIDNPSQDLYDCYCLQLVINLGMLLLLNLKLYYLRCFYIFHLHYSLSCVWSFTYPSLCIRGIYIYILIYNVLYNIS